MSFSASIVPTELRCPDCGHYIRDISPSEGYELLVATVLKTKWAHQLCPGYDVYDSALFPDTTFQVKFANAREGRTETRNVDGRELTFVQAPTWSWRDAANIGADFYVLFGVQGDLVYPFVVCRDAWMDESCKASDKARLLRVSTKAKSRCGRYHSGYKDNKFWQYAITSWPQGMFRYIEYYVNRREKDGDGFGAHCVPAGEQLCQLGLMVGN